MDYVSASRRLSRRQFVQGMGVAGLGLLVGCTLPAASPPQPARVPRIGLLAASTPADTTLTAPFEQGLRELGYVEGQNIAYEYRFALGDLDRLAPLANELVQLPVDLIATSGTIAIGAAKTITSTVPIVMLAGSDPVGAGHVVSLARPGGNVTGLTESVAGLAGKQLELLKAVAPSVTRVAVLQPAGAPSAVQDAADPESVARALAVELQPLDVRIMDDFDGAFAAIIRERAEAIYATGGSPLTSNRARITAFALQQGLPSIYLRREFVETGGLMSYGVNFPEMARRAAAHADKLLKGAKPADLPVEQPREFDFVINLQTAQVLGLTIPPHVLLQATEMQETHPRAADADSPTSAPAHEPRHAPAVSVPLRERADRPHCPCPPWARTTPGFTLPCSCSLAQHNPVSGQLPVVDVLVPGSKVGPLIGW